MNNGAVDAEPFVKVFSFNAKLWRTVDCALPTGLSSVIGTVACNVGNFVYMLASRKLMSFDLSAEVFAEIPCPVQVAVSVWKPSCPLKLTNFRDSLALLHKLNINKYHIWVMRDDGVTKSWSKIFSVDTDGGASSQLIAGFTTKGRMVVRDDCNVSVTSGAKDLQVVTYATPSAQIQDVEEWEWHVESFSFKESLFLLEEGESLPLSLPNLGSASEL